jgi:hypothetical protein
LIWGEVPGFKYVNEAVGWKDEDPKSGVRRYCLLGFTKLSEADFTYSLASGPMPSVGPEKLIRIGAWTSFGKGFRVRIRNQFFDDKDQAHVRHGVLDVFTPVGGSGWYVDVTVMEGILNLTPVATKRAGRIVQIKLEKVASGQVTVKLHARPFIRYRFNHVALRPKRTEATSAQSQEHH